MLISTGDLTSSSLAGQVAVVTGGGSGIGAAIATGYAAKGASVASRERTQLIRLRREMKSAIAEEAYERASQLRDQIRQIEGGRESRMGGDE